MQPLLCNYKERQVFVYQAMADRTYFFDRETGEIGVEPTPSFNKKAKVIGLFTGTVALGPVEFMHQESIPDDGSKQETLIPPEQLEHPTEPQTDDTPAPDPAHGEGEGQ